MGLGSCAVLEGGCEKSRRAYPPPLAVEIVRVCLCISMDLCYRPAGNILQLLISPGAEKWRLQGCFFPCCNAFSISPSLYAVAPTPCRQPFAFSFICQKTPDTLLREALFCSLGLQPLPGGMDPAQKHARTRLIQSKNWQLDAGVEGERKVGLTPVIAKVKVIPS